MFSSDIQSFTPHAVIVSCQSAVYDGQQGQIPSPNLPFFLNQDQVVFSEDLAFTTQLDRT